MSLHMNCMICNSQVGRCCKCLHHWNVQTECDVVCERWTHLRSTWLEWEGSPGGNLAVQMCGHQQATPGFPGTFPAMMFCTSASTLFHPIFIWFQVNFLEVAMPRNLTREEIRQRYEERHGHPSAEMASKMKAACIAIHSMESFQEWFEVSKSTLCVSNV